MPPERHSGSKRAIRMACCTARCFAESEGASLGRLTVQQSTKRTALVTNATINRHPSGPRRLLMALVVFGCHQDSLAFLDLPSPNQILCLSTSSERYQPSTGQVASRAIGKQKQSQTGHTIAKAGTAVKMPFWCGDHPGPSGYHPAPEKCHYFGRYLYIPHRHTPFHQLRVYRPLRGTAWFGEATSIRDQPTGRTCQHTSAKRMVVDFISLMEDIRTSLVFLYTGCRPSVLC